MAVGQAEGYVAAGVPYQAQVVVNQLDDGGADAGVVADVGVEFPGFLADGVHPGFVVAVFAAALLKVPGIPGVDHFVVDRQVGQGGADGGHLQIEAVVVAGVAFGGGEFAPAAQPAQHRGVQGGGGDADAGHGVDVTHPVLADAPHLFLHRRRAHPHFHQHFAQFLAGAAGAGGH